MKLFKSSLIALAIASMGTANAASLAITNAKVHTLSSDGVLENATVVINDGKITAINPDNVDVDQVVDAQGKILTPGFISSMNQLGLVEVGAVSRSRDASDDKADITFDPSLAFNPKSTGIAYTRKGGITQDVIVPSGGKDMFKGQVFVAQLTGDFDSVVKSHVGVMVHLGAKSKGSRATDLQALTEKLADAKKAIDKAAAAQKSDKKKDSKELKRKEKAFNAVVNGETPLLAYVNRATDILALLKLKQAYNLDLVLIGAADAVLVAEDIANANVPVIMNAMDNLPQSFDSLHNDLSNAGKLTKAGVKVALTVEDTHNAYQLRFTAGNAVANGMEYSQALAAVTKNVAEIFDLNAGQIAVGKDADLVLWSADPFELSSKVEKIWIGGEQQDTRSRHDELRDRYMATSDMPRAYTK